MYSCQCLSHYYSKVKTFCLFVPWAFSYNSANLQPWFDGSDKFCSTQPSLHAVASRCMTRLSLLKDVSEVSVTASVTGSAFRTGWTWQLITGGRRLHYTCGYHYLTSWTRAGDVVFVNVSLELNGNRAQVSGQQATSGRIRGGSVCKVMHGQYGLLLLHAPSITACGIAWGLHCKQNSIYICKTNFVLCFLFLSTCT